MNEYYYRDLLSEDLIKRVHKGFVERYYKDQSNLMACHCGSNKMEIFRINDTLIEITFANLI